MASDHTIGENISECNETTPGSVHVTLPSFELDRIVVKICLSVLGLFYIIIVPIKKFSPLSHYKHGAIISMCCL